MSRAVGLAYTACWAVLCVGALAVAVRERRSLALLGRPYWRFLLAPWKLVTFGVAVTFFLIAAPYTGDATWDRVDAGFMSGLAFATAPWSVGVLYRRLRGKASWSHAFVASCVWLLSASWSYDLYILLRDGFYPASWLGNLVASSVLYVAAGLMWNLAYVQGRGVVFGFMDDRWPDLATGRVSGRVVAFALVFVVLVVGMMVPFFLDYLPGR